MKNGNKNYELSHVAYDNLPGIDKIYYKPIYQYREPDPFIWCDCTIIIDPFDVNQKWRTWHYCIAENIETRLIYRLKQI